MSNQTQWQHCGKHDKNFSEEHPCPGCESEKKVGADYLAPVKPSPEQGDSPEVAKVKSQTHELMQQVRDFGDWVQKVLRGE